MRYQENVIKNIKDYIAKNNMQQKDFAKLVNCSESTMSRYLSKTRNISLDFVIQASKVTNINLERLVGLNAKGTIQR